MLEAMMYDSSVTWLSSCFFCLQTASADVLFKMVLDELRLSLNLKFVFRFFCSVEEEASAVQKRLISPRKCLIFDSKSRISPILLKTSFSFVFWMRFEACEPKIFPLNNVETY